MVKIRPERIVHALNNLDEWRKSVQAQGATHLLPLIALLEKNAGSGKPIHFDETPHEFAFWDKYFRIADGNEVKPYFNPITLRRIEKGFPHSNAATIRKNTFALKWHAATREAKPEGEYWTLSTDFAEVFRQKVLIKGGAVTRVPVIDLSCLLFRQENFPDGSGATALEKTFRERFILSDSDYEKIFEFRDEKSEALFTEKVGSNDYEAAIKSALLPDVAKAEQLPLPAPLPKFIELDDPILIQVQKLLNVGTAGIILTGPPGTGKSYYAKRIASHLASDSTTDIFRVQFHPSYGYEDFVEGYRPSEASQSGFRIVPKIFLAACDRASQVPGFVVLLVDEINRGDPARIFGELLTYIELDYREQAFSLPFSGREFSIPKNLLFIGTMNPHDRSVSHVDAAFVRRFDHIEISPSREVLEAMLEKSEGFSPEQIVLIGEWFEQAQALVPFGLGHSFFSGVKNVDHLKVVWRYRIKPTVVSAIELNEGKLIDFLRSYEGLIHRLEGTLIGP